MAMVGKKKSFRRVRFPAEVVSEVYEHWSRLVDGEDPRLGINEVILDDDETHTFETVASWLDAYRRNPVACTLTNITSKGRSKFNYYFDPIHGSTVEVELPSVDDVNKLIEIFEREAPNYRLPEEPAPEDVSMAILVPRPHVFIGYGGRSQAWRDLRDFLMRLGVEVETFQSETRVGQTITEVLIGMLDRANFAFLVHTAEDDMGGGRMRARENIVHETGLFQGRLGLDRAIIVREEGTEQFSNVHGLQEIRFPPGQIQAAFGEVIEVLRKHFPET
jgi:predicted nucleotide-binding protein